MAPGRRKGGNKTEAKNQLKLGDLVLAKVKGFPFWPAKVSRPEDWKLVPDPKKHFVYFFGTHEIAFVTSADIQGFTSEARNKLLARCQSKSKHFAQAVKEICEEFDSLIKKESITRRNELDKTFADGTEDDEGHSDTNDSNNGNVGANQMHSEQFGKEIADNKDSVLQDTRTLSSETSRNELDAVHNLEIKNTSESDAVIINDANGLDNQRSGRKDSHKQGMVFSRLKKKTDVDGKIIPRATPVFDESESQIGSQAEGKFLSCEMLKQSPSNLHQKISKNSLENRNKADASDGPTVGVTESKLCPPVSSDCVGEVARNIVPSDDKSTVETMHFHASSISDPPVYETQNSLVASRSGKRNIRASPQIGKPKTYQKGRSSQSNIPSVKENIGSNAIAVELKADGSGDEAVLPVSKRRKRALQAMNLSASVDENEGVKIDATETVSRASVRRRAVCLVSEEEEEDAEPKTPIHKTLENSSQALETKISDTQSVVSVKRLKSNSNVVSKVKSPLDDDKTTVKKSPSLPMGDHENVAVKDDLELLHYSSSQKHTESPAESKAVISSPNTSPVPVGTQLRLSEVSMSNRSAGKTQTNDVQGSGKSESSKVSNKLRESSNISKNLGVKNKPALSVEKGKNTAKAKPRLTDSAAAIEPFTGFEASGEKYGTLFGSKTPESSMSMKHLIAAAQAKRKQAHSQHMNYGFSNSMLASTTDVILGNTPSPLPIISTVSATLPNTHLSSVTSPTNSQTLRGNAEELDHRTDSSQNPRSGSLSCDNEAAVVRDAFEGMIETLSRTKESIGRATRMAIDCAKYGISNQVVELLVRKLENESSLHRKVDLFFLVDSITQCSHSQKGIAGSSYVPIVEASLSRLLVAAAPPGSNARENRRQCLKVLKLWLERKIFSDSILRKYMDDIGGSTEDTFGVSLRRPSRAERSVDDPIREMEGMLVDEYGSNATFQLPGFLSSNIFDDDDDIPCTAAIDGGAASNVQDTGSLKELEHLAGTPSDRRHCILEDVDGELEMEDVITSTKDESNIGAFRSGTEETNGNAGAVTAEKMACELAPLSECSPPLPPYSPPPPPPLPSSPPPLPSSPPPLPSSPPPSLLPSTLSPPPPLPPLAPLPMPSSLPLHPPPQHAAPPVPQTSMPPQPSVQSSPRILFPPQISDYSSATRANQLNSTHGNHSDVIKKNETFPQQPPPFSPLPRAPSGFSTVRPLEYSPLPQNHNFPPTNTVFVQRPMHPGLPPSGPPHFQFAQPSIPQPPISFPRPFHVPHHQDSFRPFSGDERWRIPCGEFKMENQNSSWMSGRLPQGAPMFSQEGYYRAHMERPPMSTTNYQLPVASGAQIPGHVASSALPCRPDLSSVNCWRPN